ncbi:MAG: hypothetical protein AAF629_18120 [Chloroflexota bacterium]
MSNYRYGFYVVLSCVIACFMSLSWFPDDTLAQGGATYYVSNTLGNDSHDGLSEATPLQTIAAVNALNLQPGDQVLFRCGDTWRTESLIITESGTVENPIQFSSYPANCENKPIISGSQQISGWTLDSGNVYVADLSAGNNAGKFPLGINQLFQDEQRLPMGRWPNLDANNDGGYSTVDGHPNMTQLVDNELPQIDWTGGVIHIKGIRWYILNRIITGSSGNTLTLGADTDCWNGCTGWGYFINSHRQTLDQEGEWYYDADTHRVYLYSTTGVPADNIIEGSVIMAPDSSYWGGIVLGFHLFSHISYVTIENFTVQNWYESGITTPLNLETDDNAHLIIRNNHIRNVESTGIRLATWVWNASNGVSGWRGGHDLEIADNIIEGANHFGLDSYAYGSTIRDNQIRDIGLIENVGRAGLGCGFAGANCTENGNGIRLKLDNVAYSSHSNTLQYNRLEKIGMNGIDVFGPHNILEYNVIKEACYTKGDCGAVRTFGRNSLAASDVHDVAIRNNIIIDTVGNTDGTAEFFRPPFGIGLYIDHYSRDVTVSGNTVISSTIDGLLFQNSTGSIQNNVLYNNNLGTMSRGQVGLYQAVTNITNLSGNVMYGLNRTDAFNFAKTLHAESSNKDNIVSADHNYYFNPYRPDHISVEGLKTLSDWQTYSNFDANSTTNWFTLAQGESPRSTIFYNDTKENRSIDLGNRAYLDLDQNPVSGSLTLSPFASQVLIDNGTVSLAISSIDPPFLELNNTTVSTLTVYGLGFTENSIIRWDGVDRSTTFISSTELRTAIQAGDTSTVGNINISVYEPGANPAETGAEILAVLANLQKVYLPLVIR